VYPVILFGLFEPPRLFWLRWAFLAAATGFALYAHGAIETPRMQMRCGPSTHYRQKVIQNSAVRLAFIRIT
jgi:hypothetical protein